MKGRGAHPPPASPRRTAPAHLSRRAGRGLRRLLPPAAALLFFVSIAHAQENWILPTRILFRLDGAQGKPFRQPTDVALDSRGRIFVMDGLNCRVAVFSASGEPLHDFGTCGEGPGQMRMPVGLGLSPADEVFVADTGNHRIQVFSTAGRFLRAFPLRTGADADPTDVMPIALEDSCYVVDNDAHEIQVYRARTGAFVRAWGGHGKNLGEFRYPATIAVDAYNHLYVVDVMNARVQTFDPFGNEAREITHWGVTRGRVFRPKGVAVDRDGDIYVSDSYMEVVQVFRNRGVFRGILGDEEGRIRRFTAPTNIKLDSTGRLLVTETRANRVSVLQLLQ